MFNNIKFKSFIHSSSILKSDRPNPISDSNFDLSNLEQVENARIERESKLQVAKYQQEENSLEQFNNDMPTIDIPLELQSQFGLKLEHTHPISMFDGVEIISKYLELKHNIAPETISETKLTEILKIFDNSKRTVTVEELFQHMNNLFEKDKEFYIDKLKTETKNLSEKISENSINKDSKPFSLYGEITLNELSQNLKENLKHLNNVR